MPLTAHITTYNVGLILGDMLDLKAGAYSLRTQGSTTTTVWTLTSLREMCFMLDLMLKTLVS